MLNKIGYINSIDYDGLLNELKPLDREQRQAKYWREKLYTVQSVELIKDKLILGDCTSCLLSDCYTKSAEGCYEKSVEIIDRVKKTEKHNKLFNIRFEIKFLNEEFVAFLYSTGAGIVLPREYVEIELAKNYDNLTFTQINNLITGGEIKNDQLSVIDDKSHNDVKDAVEKAKNDLETAEAQAKKELEEFEQKMREMERELRKKHELALSELREKVEFMKDQIFILEMNIFALRSYFGETFSIAHVMKGKNAPEEQPLVLYQKFRYMDEELSRLTANSEFSTHGTEIAQLFEEYGDLFVETFCPNTKCITFFKVSKDNRYMKYNHSDDVIEEFEYYHGNQIGMIIRNGENLYLSFIDEEVTLQDNLFMSENTKNSEKGVTIGETRVRDKEARTIINRRNLFIIIQALLKNTNIYQSLKGENLMESNKIIFSNADSQIRFNKYPTFKEFFNSNCGHYHENLKYGDIIFIDDNHAGSKSERNYWGSGYHEEHRGRGYRNTGRDADIKQGINKLNIINREPNGYYVFYNEGSHTYKKHVYSLDDELIKAGNKYEPRIDVEFYVSCKRVIDDYDWRRYNRYTGKMDVNKKFNNANLRIYGDEFMSVMWCNSNYVQQWIDNKDSGNGKNFVYFVKMLKELKQFMLDREEKEFTEINKFVKVDNTPANKDLVLDWKIKHNVRNITEFQAQRFSKYYKETNK